MTYERMTAATARDALDLAAEVLRERLPIEVVARAAHTLRLTGGDGTVTFTAHRHGLDTLLHAATDQLRTSRLDLDVQYVMTLLPYQPGDRRGVAPTLPRGLSRL